MEVVDGYDLSDKVCVVTGASCAVRSDVVPCATDAQWAQRLWELSEALSD